MNNKIIMGLIICYFIFISFALITNYEPGIMIAHNFWDFVKSMLLVLPSAFILIGLFEVWVKKETVEKYFGHTSGVKGLIGAVILSCTTVGGIYVALPVAYSLYQKGARLSVILTFISSSAITRIPMTVFEATFLGIKFSLIRLIVSIPLVILSSIILGNTMEKKLKLHNLRS